MNRLYLFFIGLFWITTIVTQEFTGDAYKLGLEAQQAIQEKSADRLKYILNEATNKWRNQPDQFLKFLNARNGDDWTLLMYAAALDDPERIRMILDAAENGFREDPNYLIEVINAQSDMGKTALYIAGDYNNIEAINFLVERVGLIFKDNKKEFLQFLTMQEKDFEWSPLMLVAFQSASDAVHTMVEKAVDVFGPNSPELLEFLNKKNIYDDTAFSLALDPWDKFYLLRHGAEEHVPYMSEKLKKQVKMAKDLLHVVKHRGTEEHLRRLITHFIELWPDDKRGFLHFIGARDDAGWLALTNAVADGNKTFVQIIIDTALDYYKNDPRWILYLLYSPDIHGRTPLHIAVTRKQLDMVKTLLDTQKKVFGNNKKLFAEFVNYHSELNGFTPFIKAAYISENDQFSHDLLTTFLKRAQEVFGLNNAWFERFINAKDLDGYTALSYVMVPNLRDLLKRYGAIDPIEPPQLQLSRDQLTREVRSYKESTYFTRPRYPYDYPAYNRRPYCLPGCRY